MSDTRDTESSPPDPQRRKVLAGVATALGLGAVGAVTVPAVVAVNAPLTIETVRSSGDFALVGKISEFQPNVPRAVEIKASKQDAWSNLGEVTVGKAWVIKRESGDFQVFSAVCPHLGCGVDWKAADKRFSCPCHVSYFSLDGDIQEGPSKRGLDPLEFKIEDDELLVRFQRFELNTEERVSTEG